MEISAPEPRSLAAVDSFLNSFDDEFVTAPTKAGAMGIKGGEVRPLLPDLFSDNEWTEDRMKKYFGCSREYQTQVNPVKKKN